MSGGFRFKQFFVAHDNATMKVGTDSILLGSWAEVPDSGRCLDIGTGSGILALMLAQRSANVRVTALELDEVSVQVARQNALNSPWPARIEVLHERLQSHDALQYECIVANPPYFPAAAEHAQHQHMARHQVGLSLHELAHHVGRLLAVDGIFSLVLPLTQGDEFIAQALHQGLHVQRRLNISATSGSEIRRVLVSFGRAACDPVIQSLHIYDENRQYSAAFRQLCRAFYLNF